MSRHILVRIAMVFCLLLPLGASAAPFSNLIIFGDSMSDVGNFSVATAGAIPGDPHFQGRFSNGFNYADRLAAHLALPLIPSLAGGTNFAFGGARTHSHPFDAGLSLLEQVEAFTTRLGGMSADPEALYVVFAGANNLQDALLNPNTATDVVLNAVTDIQFVIIALATKGAQHVLVPNLPNLGLVPRVTALKAIAPGISAFATALTMLFNTELATTLDALDTFPNLDLIRFDTFALLQEIVTSPPGVFGLTNVTD